MTTTAPEPYLTLFDDHLSSQLLRQRIVVLGGEVTDASANRVCAQLLLLSAENPRADIGLYINSPGGSVSAGTRGKRAALPNARIMMHQGSAGIGGTAIDIEIQAQNLDHMKRLMTSLLAQNTGQSEATIERDSDRDRWFTAAEARDYGMVDRVVQHLDDVRPDGTARKVGL
jgi:ATP-dependent Clp protease protease subunit